MELEIALQEEINFWQSMIDLQDENMPVEALERMTQAKTLAEYKLSFLLRDCSANSLFE